MKDYRFQFERPGSRHTCPQCNKRREFTRYIDLETGELLPDHVGVCNNAGKCGYNYTVKQFLQDNPDYLKSNTFTRSTPQRRAVIQQPKQVDHFPEQYMRKSLTGYAQNNFVRYLESIFPTEIVTGLIDRYKIGTSQSPWPGSVIFWQVDSQGNIRSGKVMLYNPVTGSRIKKPFNHTTWAHALLKKYGKAENFALQQCLFGAHLIQAADRIAVVEAEKTAIVASVFYPEYVWVATGGLGELNDSLMKDLKGKEVILFPDKGYYQNRWTETDPPREIKGWKERAAKLETHFRKLSISQVVESLPIPDGGDLADWLPGNAPIPEQLVRCNLESPNNDQRSNLERRHDPGDNHQIEMHPAGYPASWN